MPDAVVIGSGPNGLAAAIRLAEAGRDVVVLEASDRPGGAVRTEELTLPGFHHDTFSSVYPAAVASPVIRRLPLDRYGLEWVHPEACMAHPFPDGSAALLYRDLHRTASGLDALHAGDGERWAGFAAPYLEASDAVRHTMLAGFPPVRGPLELLRDAGPLRTLAFAAGLPAPATRLARRLFHDERTRAWFYGPAMHGDTPPHSPGSAIAAFYLTLLGHAVGWPSPRGGAGAIAAALVAHLEALGGEVRCDARATAVTSAHGHVTGVRVAGGEHVAARTVVATVLPGALLDLAGDALGGWYAAGLRHFRIGQGTIKVDWALDGPIPWTNADVRQAGTVHVVGGETAFLDAVKTSEEHLPDRPFVLLGQQSLADPSRAPAGCHTAWAYTHAPADLLDPAGPRAAHVDRVEAQVERFAPGFRERILARHVMGPADLEARDANLVRGDIGGGSYRLRQLVFRPLPKLDPYRTPLDGLYLGSAATFPGGAVHGVPGDAAARSALRHDRR
ncbi:NAD(P)/FAD-dependent oxidoreductase [Paraconexibacter antarcticus]|uniref:Pyridine nucleotide-disulfide oxidoreductase domain-containing protein 2 n=1 Tax=Paraconexibacter antarcticus TaxID=2949664 RepID=A0ABY5DYX9_9ACTN|nr:NAD(P)/FAD-dependent oxidoreductase [Paraconexibacter antarcticus]UTI66077.1 NAD(P)/FAD-dependent oxidoreductase [Paraconexibacter antarcticus]